jgi:hypothetical protein
MSGVVWSIKDHHRFRRLDRYLVRFILWLRKHTQCTLKDIWIHCIIPKVIDQMTITYIYVSNLPFSMSATAFKHVFVVPIDDVLICLRRNGYSKGFGFFRTVRYDDYLSLCQNREIRVDNVVFCLSRTLDNINIQEYCQKHPIPPQYLQFARGVDIA